MDFLKRINQAGDSYTLPIFLKVGSVKTLLVTNQAYLLLIIHIHYVQVILPLFVHLLPLNFIYIATAICYGNDAAETAVTDCRKCGHFPSPKSPTAEMYYIRILSVHFIVEYQTLLSSL